MFIYQIEVEFSGESNGIVFNAVYLIGFIKIMVNDFFLKEQEMNQKLVLTSANHKPKFRANPRSCLDPNFSFPFF